MHLAAPSGSITHPPVAEEEISSSFGLQQNTSNLWTEKKIVKISKRCEKQQEEEKKKQLDIKSISLSPSILLQSIKNHRKSGVKGKGMTSYNLKMV